MLGGLDRARVRRRALARFSATLMADRYEAIYRNLMAAPTAGSRRRSPAERARALALVEAALEEPADSGATDQEPADLVPT
jgi:hypothetical protein